MTALYAGDGFFWVDDFPYRKTSIYPDWDVRNETLTLRIGGDFGRPILNTLHYSEITDGDTGNPFASLGALCDWVGANILKESTGSGSGISTVATAKSVVPAQNVTVDIGGVQWISCVGGPCDCVDVMNNSDAVIEYRRTDHVGALETLLIQPMTSRLIVGITDTSQLQFRRQDQQPIPTTIHTEAITVR